MTTLGVIPAAGRSTRIGNPKPLLDANGRSFLERTTAALRDGGVDRIVVGVRDGSGPIAALARRLGAEPFVPEDVEEGPIASVRGALLSAEVAGELRSAVSALVLLPVDFPCVKPGTVRALIEGFAASNAPLVRPATDGRTGHPVLFGAALFPELVRPGLPEGARSVVDRHRDAGEVVEVDDPGIHVDIDTLPEYRRHFPDSYRKRFQKW